MICDPIPIFDVPRKPHFLNVSHEVDIPTVRPHYIKSDSTYSPTQNIAPNVLFLPIKLHATEKESNPDLVCNEPKPLNLA